MKIIGITGGYAAGKTAVAKIFGKLGAEVLSADKIARMVILPGTEVWKKIVKYFGETILLKNRNINRRKLAEIVFMDKGKLLKLNKFVHPEVKREIRRIINAKKNAGNAKALVLEVPLLFEAGMENWFDSIITVTCDKETQYQRAFYRDKISYPDFKRRIKSQMLLSEKRKKADYAIDNSRYLAETKKQVEKIWRKLMEC